MSCSILERNIYLLSNFKFYRNLLKHYQLKLNKKSQKTQNIIFRNNLGYFSILTYAFGNYSVKTYLKFINSKYKLFIIKNKENKTKSSITP